LLHRLVIEVGINDLDVPGRAAIDNEIEPAVEPGDGVLVDFLQICPYLPGAMPLHGAEIPEGAVVARDDQTFIPVRGRRRRQSDAY
jgi:hypothetical protein